jgi:hypothetical protein
LVDDHRRAKLNIEGGFILEQPANLEFVPVKRIHFRAEQTFDRRIPVVRFDQCRVRKISLREIDIGAADNRAKPPANFCNTAAGGRPEAVRAIAQQTATRGAA